MTTNYETPPFDAKQDAEQNKVMAMLAYLLFFVPILTGDVQKSPFVKFHTNQGTILFIAAVAFSIVLSIITSIMGAGLALAALVNPFLATVTGMILFVFNLLGLAPIAFAIYGAINAANGEMKELPYIGKYTIIK